MKNELPDINSLWDYNKPADSESRFRKLLPKARKLKDNSYYIELLTQLARSQGLQQKFDDSHKTLDKAMKLITGKKMHVIPRIRYMLERGRTYNSSGVKDKAKEIFLAAYDQAVKYGEEFYAVDAAHMMGIVETGVESLRWNEKAVKLAESSGDEKAGSWLGALYNNIGWAYHDMNEYNKALDIFKKALVWRQAKKQDAETRIAKWCVARALRSLKKPQEALDMQMNLLEEIKSKSAGQDGYVFEEIGECLLELGKGKEAVNYFKTAYDLLSKDPWLVMNEKDRLNRLKKLSEPGK